MTTKSSLPLMLLRTSLWTWVPLASVWYLEKTTFFGQDAFQADAERAQRTLGSPVDGRGRSASFRAASYSWKARP